MTTIGDLLAIFATCDIAKRRELANAFPDLGIREVQDHRLGTLVLWDAGGYTCGWFWHNPRTGDLSRCEAGSCAAPPWPKEPTRVLKRPVCTPCREGRHDECAAIVDERDSTPQGEVREWEEACACDAPACAYDLGEYEQGREEMHAEDENDG